MGDFCTRLLAARTAKNWGQTRLAREAQVSRQTIVAWEKNPHQRHEPDKLARVAAALGKDVSDLEPVGEPAAITTPARLHSWLNQHLESVIEAEVQRRMGTAGSSPGNILNITERRVRQLLELGQAMPVLGDVAAGVPIPAQPDIQGWVRFEADRHYLLAVRGDSMIEAGINDGDWVVVDRNADWRENEAVVARVLEDNETTVKYWTKSPTGGRVRLVPANSELEAKDYEEADIAIDGKAIAVMRPIPALKPPRRRKSA